jgi:hypothetical protein
MAVYFNKEEELEHRIELLEVAMGNVQLAMGESNNKGKATLQINSVIGCFLTDVIFEYEHPSGTVRGKLIYDDDEETLMLRYSEGGYITLPDLDKCKIVNAL